MTAVASAGRRPQVGALGSISAVANDDMWTYYERLREIGDVVWDPETSVWLVSSYDLVRRVCRGDTTDFETMKIYDTERETFSLTAPEWVEVFHDGNVRKLSITSGSDHERMHRWWFRAFSPKALAIWDALIEPIAHRAIDALAARGRAELTSEYCDPVLVAAVAIILGLPADDTQWFELARAHAATRPDTQPLIPHSGEHLRALSPRMRALPDLLRPIVRERQGGDGNDFISILWRDADELFGPTYTLEDVAGTALNALMGATDSVGVVSANLFHTLLVQPGLQGEAIAGGELAMKRLVEEVVRLYGLAPIIKRRVTRDLILGDVALRKDDVVACLLTAADRDPRHYSEPGMARLDRPSPTDHLGFWMGERACAGQTLARFVVQRMASVAMDRMREMRADPDAAASGYVGRPIRRWSPVHAVFTAKGSV
jgi:cytochrome P450